LKGPVLTAPNVISILRVPMGLAACLFLVLRLPVPALTMIFLAVASDYIDGYWARRRNSVSDWGRIFDPLADKIALGAFIITLTALGAVPLWFVILFLTRDALIAAGGIYMTRRLGSPPSSNIWGKYCTCAMSLYLTLAAVSYLFRLSLWPRGLTLAGLDPLGLMALGFVLISLFVYFHQSLKTLRNADTDTDGS